jgi:tetratricopeptide (TPR) repeat protein
MTKANRRVSSRGRALSRRAIIFSSLYLIAAFTAFAYFFLPSAPTRFNEPFFDGLGTYSREVSTDSAMAQRYFDQGLIFTYSFNYPEAVRSFTAATEHDPRCAMAFWGIALANGPHINRTEVSDRQARDAWNAIQTAEKLQDQTRPVERALIGALSKRYAYPQPVDRAPLDRDYAAAMQQVLKAFPEDDDIGALTAESLMDLRPWDQWTNAGKPKPGTREILDILDKVLSKSPDHPLALHLKIHALEASPYPEKAAAAANRLRDLVPGAEHLVHMPSHIDVRVGHWQEAIVANERAIAAEKSYLQTTRVHDAYSPAHAHNHHMLAFAAVMQGESARATQAVKDLLAEIPEDYVTAFPEAVDGFFAMPFELDVRFGRWDAILAEPQVSSTLPITAAVQHYARATAFAAKKRVDEAKAEQPLFRLAIKKVPKGARIRRTPAADLLVIADAMLAGEIYYRQNKVSEAIATLRQAVHLEGDLPYSEPPNWLLPARHLLGATLLDAGRYSEAEAEYREDLKRYPQNGWALYGLSRSLSLQHRMTEAAVVESQFKTAWQYADVPLSSSCFCLRQDD